MIPIWIIGVVIVIIGAIVIFAITDPFEIIIMAAIAAFMLSMVMEK